MPIENASMMIPGFSREIPIKDLPLEATDIHGMISNRYGFGPVESEGLSGFISDVAMIESEGGTRNPGSSAKGTFQFLNLGTGNSFQTGLNRLVTAYKVLGGDVPEWIPEARKHNNPELLTDAQQRDLALGNIFSSIEDPDDTERLIGGASRGDLGSRMELYMDYHHRGDPGTKEEKRARRRATSIFSGNYSHGGLIRDVYGRTLI